MLQSFMFVPANSLRFIKKSKELLADYIVYDLEDAVLKDELEECFENISSVQLGDNQLVRFSVFDENSNLNESDFEKLLKIGFRRFVVPKFSGVSQAEALKGFLEKYRSYEKVSFVLLIEDPASLLSISEVLNRNLIEVAALALGSHDYCNAMGMKHTNSNLYFAKQMILNHAKAFGVEAIDTASVNVEADVEFKSDSLDGFNMGFDGKFVIHPRQVNLLKGLMYYTPEEVLEAELVYDKVIDILDKKTAVVRLNGKVFEKPHVKRIINIVNWKNKYGTK